MWQSKREKLYQSHGILMRYTSIISAATFVLTCFLVNYELWFAENILLIVLRVIQRVGQLLTSISWGVERQPLKLGWCCRILDIWEAFVVTTIAGQEINKLLCRQIIGEVQENSADEGGFCMRRREHVYALWVMLHDGIIICLAMVLYHNICKR